MIVIANEFLDTLPVAQWVFRDGAWRERGIGLDTTGRLAFVDGRPTPTSRRQAMSHRRAMATSGNRGMLP